MRLVIATTGDPGSVLRPVREQLLALDRDQPVAGIETMTQVLADSLTQPRFVTLLLGSFAALALLLASIGIYGLISYTVAQRVREIGIRMALGAMPRNVLGMVVFSGVKLAGIGLGIGVVAAALASRA